MPFVFANQAHLPDGWARNVQLEIIEGKIASITKNSQPGVKSTQVDCLLPSLGNLHSHSFQRAMAGMTEFRAAGKESFWTWRDLMYRFLEKLTPEDYETIASLVFMEMLEAGFAAVGEFHYVHHQNKGKRFDQLSELSLRIFSAAKATGIGLTHLPVLYTYGGAGKQPLATEQKRFGNSVDELNQLIAEASEKVSLVNLDAQVGIAPHSLRATSPDDLTNFIASHPHGPVHIHISEQPKEVDDIKAWLGARPVDWLLENEHVNDRWCMVHATHMTDSETSKLARSGAVAGLCPITEANLGDGPFNGPVYLANNGAFGIGSDSNVHISLSEELRTLEYSQRLRDIHRNVLVDGVGSVGENLYLSAAIGGAQALGRNAGKIQIGMLADLTAINTNDMALCALNINQIFDGFCFAASDRVVTDVWAAGRHLVQEGLHINREQIQQNYIKSITRLLSDI